MPGGGCPFNNLPNLQGEVSPENILTMFDTAYVNGFYSWNAQAKLVKTKPGYAISGLCRRCEIWSNHNP